MAYSLTDQVVYCDNCDDDTPNIASFVPFLGMYLCPSCEEAYAIAGAFDDLDDEEDDE